LELARAAEEALIRAVIEDADREDEERVGLEALMHERHRRLEVADREEHVLRHVTMDELLPHLLRHRLLQEAHLRRAEPAQEPAVERVVREGDELADLPEDRLRMPVVILPER